MARFIGEVHGSRGPASRLGTPKSGITAHVRGWNVGFGGWMEADGDNDVAHVNATCGSAGYRTIPLADLAEATSIGGTRAVVSVVISPELAEAISAMLAAHGYTVPAHDLRAPVVI